MPTSNELLEDIAKEFAILSQSNFEPDLEELVSKFSKTRQGKRGSYQFINLLTCFSELAMGSMMREVCGEYEERVEFDPILSKLEDLEERGISKPMIRTAHYKFRIGYGGTLEPMSKKRIKKGSRTSYAWNTHTDYDGLMLADNLPVLLEMKFQIYRDAETCAELPRKQSKGMIRNAVKEERINYVTAPIKEYFGTDECGFVVVMPPEELVRANEAKDGNIEEFKSKGGIILPFYTDKETWKETMRETRNKYNL